jgi:hypothetical protein
MKRYGGLILLALCGGIAPQIAFAGNEIMVDRCSNDVAIVASYNALPGSNDVVTLRRGSNGKTAWTPPFSVKTSSGGHIRWWCHSTKGNFLDVGTWRIQEIGVGTKCKIYADGSPQSCSPDGNLKLGSSEWKGWTPERSRCSNHSKRIRARLDGDRKLLIECLGP